nr:DMT family transporter [Pseudovibrio flavus]
MFIMPFFMSSNIIFGRVAIEQTNPWTLAFLRWTLAFFCLLPFAANDLRTHMGTIKQQKTLLLGMSFLGMWICGAIVYLALKSTSATNGTLIYSAAPVVIILLEWMFRGRSIALRELVGIALAMTGVATIVTRGSTENLLGLEFTPGDLLFGLCTVSWALYSVLIRKRALQSIPTMALFAALAAGGALLLFPFALVELFWFGSFPATVQVWLSIAGIVVIASVLSFSSYQYGIKQVGAPIAGMFMYLMTPYGVGMAILFLGEEPQFYQLLGFIPIMAGLILATFPFQLLFGARKKGKTA